MDVPELPTDRADIVPDDLPRSSDRWKIWLRRSDQVLLVAIFGASLLLICLSMGYSWWTGRHPVEIDQSEPLTIDYRVDLNTAEWPELTTLPGIGEKLARRIVEYRDTNGPFKHDESLLEVSGIGPKKLDGIRPHLLPLD